MKDHAIAIGRVFLLATLLALLPTPVASQADSTTVQVVRVIDGDTIQVCCVFGDRVTVRYIGMDTPEIHHPMKGVERYGKEASEANRKLVDGKTVRLEFDVQEQGRYGRLLAYVYLEDGTFVNAWLVENGYAVVMTIPPNVKHQELFLKLQREAREAKRGLWKREKGETSSSGVSDTTLPIKSPTESRNGRRNSIMASLSWLPILSLFISVGTLLYVAKTYAVHYRPYMGIVNFKHTLEGNPPTLMYWRCGIKNVGSIPAWIEMQESSVIVTMQGQTPNTVPVTTFGKIYLVPEQITYIRGRIDGATLQGVLNGTRTLEVRVKLNYKRLGRLWKKNYHYTSTTRFVPSGQLSGFVFVSTEAN